MTSWKTTIAGALLLLAACVAMATGHVDPIVGGGMIAAGLGLIAARDNGVSSEQAGAKPTVGQLVPRELAPGEVLAEGELPAGSAVVSSTPIPAPGFGRKS